MNSIVLDPVLSDVLDKPFNRSFELKNLDELSYAYGVPTVTGTFNKSSSDFAVEEVLKFTPTGSGEHIFLFIQKENANTEWVARHLAKFLKVSQREVSYAGLKDRHGLTSQWFSIRMPKMTPIDWDEFKLEGVKILKSTRHDKKLRKNCISLNRFKIYLKDITDKEGEFEKRLRLITTQGFPNYFGEQRFGFDNQNLEKAALFFDKKLKNVTRHLAGIYLSAVRGFLFNNYLDLRISKGYWNKPIPGDVFLLDGTHSFFKLDHEDGTDLENERTVEREAFSNAGDIQQRLEKQDIHISGPLYGMDGQPTLGLAQDLEVEVISQEPKWLNGLIAHKLESSRRSIRVIPSELHYSLNERSCYLEFNLCSGSYATMFLRELLRT